MDKKLLISILMIGWFSLIPFFWHIDLSNVQIGYFDMFALAPLGLIHMSVFFVILFVSLLINAYSFLNIFLTVLYLPLITISNFPYLTFRDVYLHGGSVRVILESGKLPSKAATDELSWPSSIINHAILSNVTTLNIVISNYVLFVALLSILILVLFALMKTLKKNGYLLSWAAPLLFIALLQNWTGSTFTSFARMEFSYILFLLFFLCFLRFRDGLGIVIQGILIVSIATIHPYQSLLVALFLVVISILEVYSKSTRRTYPMALFALIVFFAWSFFYASQSFLDIGNWLKNIFSSANVLSSAPYVYTKLPFWGTILINYYKYSLFAFLGLTLILASVILIARRKKSDGLTIFSSAAISAIVASIIIAFAVLLVPYSSIYRSVVYLAFPVSFLPIICGNELLKKKLSLRLNDKTKKIIIVLSALLVVSLLFSSTILTFEQNTSFGELQYNSENSSLSFLFNNSLPITVVTDFNTAMYSAYFNYNDTSNVLYVQPPSGTSLTETLALTLTLVNSSNASAVVIGIRFLGYASSAADEKALPNFELELFALGFSEIYSNSDFQSIVEITCLCKIAYLQAHLLMTYGVAS